MGAVTPRGESCHVTHALSHHAAGFKYLAILCANVERRRCFPTMCSEASESIHETTRPKTRLGVEARLVLRACFPCCFLELGTSVVCSSVGVPPPAPISSGVRDVGHRHAARASVPWSPPGVRGCRPPHKPTQTVKVLQKSLLKCLSQGGPRSHFSPRHKKFCSWRQAEFFT